MADILAYRAVILEIIRIRVIEVGWGWFITRIKRYTPAVTKVEEWTRAEIGVGAAIAAGNHAENGNWALFEHAAITRNNITKLGIFSFIVKFQLQIEARKAIESKIKISPTRLEKIVIEPDADEEAFW